MEENKLFHERYFLERLLGRGNFSEVWLAKDTKTDIQVALKIYAPATGLDDAGLNVFAREFSLVINANHKNLLKPTYYDSSERKPYLVLPYCQQGSILKSVGKFSEMDAWRLIRDVACGLAWLHNMNPPIIHQDIKPDNIMIGDNGDFMITDFGVSTHVKSTLRKSLSAAFSSAGTIAYMAPERFGKDNTPIMANDIYSLGATVFEMLSGDAPFGNDGGLMQKKGAEVPELQGNYSNQLKKVIHKCLKTNPWERPTAEQLEQYADCGLQGQNIAFVDEKTFGKKYRLLICIVLVLAVLGGCLGGFLVKQNVDKQRLLKRELGIQTHNDSVRSEIKKLTLIGDSLSEIGDIHDEGYENAYLDAYANYQKIIENENSFWGDMKIANKDVVINKMRELEKKLKEAYLSIQEKAKLFENDLEIGSEFKERALRIKAVIDVDENISSKDSLITQ